MNNQLVKLLNETNRQTNSVAFSELSQQDLKSKI